MSDEEIRGSRFRRAASITGTAAGVAAREATARAMVRTAGSSDARRAAASRQQLKSAQALVKVFAGMRGAAMKVGQTLSAVDLGMVPEEIRPEFQAILAQLQQGADPVSFKAITKVIESDLGEKLRESFADIDPEPIAAASIGQVHRATLHDGRDVAVKVQYPGIAEAIHADMQNLRLGLKLLSAIAPGIDTGAIAGEIRERITEELDYELEASNQQAMARVYRGHPFAVVPGVVTDLCRERVIVTDYVEAMRFAEFKDTSSQAERDRAAEIIVRFYLNGPMRHRLLNGDPHPGNTLFLPDGRIAFLDFGFFKRMGDDEVRHLVKTTRALHENDPMGLLEIVAELGALPADPALAQPFYENYEAIFGWLLDEEPTRIDASQTAQMMRRYTAMRGDEGFDQMTLPAEHFVLMRGVMLVIGLLGQLQAEGRWFDVAREWLLGDDPRTGLGKAEAAFFGTRHEYTTGVAA
ncbi:AarF/ABC1/UbiB kinase family protein [Paraconexibacter antarcticus]|uniref:AarF/ABC1/UbiB kinase family protein n=1 Tax=Paraconexibacter antarcticus TaxID=2949664 RepID=A0ABY5DQV0_9ACTN|nr:AarF/ABC1/UbiB kinase family protein [Paraconexibacter antarcticus]UTI63835.1 AarF/ABC1/UbiB kinase family protein [Paraconexibacter antarcticus]